jgi:hypothetical protein
MEWERWFTKIRRRPGTFRIEFRIFLLGYSDDLFRECKFCLASSSFKPPEANVSAMAVWVISERT